MELSDIRHHLARRISDGDCHLPLLRAAVIVVKPDAVHVTARAAWLHSTVKIAGIHIRAKNDRCMTGGTGFFVF